MPYFKDKTGNLHYLEDKSFIHLLPVGSVEIPEEKIKPVAEAINIWGLIKAERDTIKTKGIKVGRKWFHTDPNSRTQYLSLSALGSNIPADLQWKTMDGSFVTMTAELVQRILSAIVVNDAAIFKVAEDHKAALQNSKDPASYDFSANWPAVFKE